MKYFGAHVSASGGVYRAPERAVKIGADAFALFTANQRQWKSVEIDEETAMLFRNNLRKSGILPEHVLPHDSYLINLASRDEMKREKSVKALAAECQRAHKLGLKYLNIHPGSHLGQFTEEEALKQIAESIDMVFEMIIDNEMTILLENTAGQGTALGYRIEHLGDIIRCSSRPDRIGICIDTCHAFAAGYDISTKQGIDEMIRIVDGEAGLHRLKAFHMNDSKKKLGSRVDRHASLGMGFIGIEAFTSLVRRDDLDERIFILETPEPSIWEEEIRILREASHE